MKVIAITNEKGGVGKTTTAISLGYELKKAGKSVLLIDNDPQANLSTHCGIRNLTAEEKKHHHSLTNLYEYLIDNLENPDIETDIQLPPAEEVIIHTNGFDYIASDINLESAERQMYVTSGTDMIMEDVINAYGESYDYVLIDCRPSLGKLTINAMTAADSVIITVPAEYYALDGLTALLGRFKIVKRKMNKKLKIEGILFTLNQNKLRLTKALTTEIRKKVGNSVNVFESVIPASVRVKEAVAINMAIGEYEPDNPAAIGYRELAKEIIDKEGE